MQCSGKSHRFNHKPSRKPLSGCRAAHLPEPCEHLLDQVMKDRLAATTTMAAGMAHEINNPLTYVLGNLELVQRVLSGNHDGGRQQEIMLLEAIDEAMEGARRIGELVSTMRAFSHDERTEFQATDPVRILNHAIRIAASPHQHRVKLYREYAPVPRVALSEARLGQLALCLLWNAIQSLPPGTSRRGEIHVRLRSSDEAEYVLLEIHDNGEGIPAEIRNRIFDPFFTTREPGGGTGLGLAICHDIVSKAGGSIDVSSRENAGTTFRVTLPALLETSRPPRRFRDRDITPTKKRVLVVDNDATIRKVVLRALGKHAVTMVESGPEALEACRHTRYDVILVELVLPSMAAMTFYRKLAGSQPGLEKRVVFLSGTQTNARTRAFLRTLPNPVLSKPFSLDQLVGLVHTTPAEHEATPPRAVTGTRHAEAVHQQTAIL